MLPLTGHEMIVTGPGLSYVARVWYMFDPGSHLEGLESLGGAKV